MREQLALLVLREQLALRDPQAQQEPRATREQLDLPVRPQPDQLEPPGLPDLRATQVPLAQPERQPVSP